MEPPGLAFGEPGAGSAECGTTGPGLRLRLHPGYARRAAPLTASLIDTAVRRSRGRWTRQAPPFIVNAGLACHNGTICLASALLRPARATPALDARHVSQAFL